MKKICILFLFFINICIASFAQQVQLTYRGGRNYSLVERTDLRRYDNNRYVGLLSREVRSFISNDGELYEGSFYVSQDTVRASSIVGKGLHDSIPSVFKISEDGKLTMLEDHGFPSFRSFPAFTENKIKIGDSWQASAVRAVDPLNKGIPTKIPMYVEYTYKGDEVVRGENVYVLTAKWATRYGMGTYTDYDGDRELVKAQGAHSATMYVSKESGYAIVVRDSVDESFVYADGKVISLKGTISLFTEYPPAVDRSKIIRALQRVAAIDEEEAKALSERSHFIAAAPKTSVKQNSSSIIHESKKIEDKTPPSKKEKLSRAVKKSSESLEKPIKVEDTASGIRLTIQNLQFKPDSAELLPGEKIRLDQIASVLREVPESQFLVEGHTADTGYEKGEMKLSAERAHAIAKELSLRGIPAEKFICKGSGAHKPISDNSTQEGKALNRRVEITILE